MFLLIVSNASKEHPDFWEFKDSEVAELLTYRDEYLVKGKTPLILHIDNRTDVITKLFEKNS